MFYNQIGDFCLERIVFKKMYVYCKYLKFIESFFFIVVNFVVFIYC